MPKPQLVRRTEFFCVKYWDFKRVFDGKKILEPSLREYYVAVGALKKAHRELLENTLLADVEGLDLSEFLYSDQVHHFDELTKGEMKKTAKKYKIEMIYDDDIFVELSTEPLAIYCYSKSLTKDYYLFKGEVFLAEGYEDFETEIVEKQTKERHRERIPDETQIFVWNRDGGICVKCGSNENLAFDHIIPFSKGGSNSRRNLQLLCDSCNLKKGNTIGG